MPTIVKPQQGNQWATITEMSIENHLAPIRCSGISPLQDYESELATVTFTGIAPATPEIIHAIHKWARGGQRKFPFYAQEWMCLYCGSPNPLPDTHCKKCGAPRNWLIG